MSVAAKRERPTLSLVPGAAWDPITPGLTSKSPLALKTPHNPNVTPISLKGSDHDLSRLPSGELFARFSVSEVLALQNRLRIRRAEADGKQEELRQMVGERYRDLLQASTSILTMRDSSNRVVSALDSLEEASADSETSAFQSIPHHPRKGERDDGQLEVLQSLSAHLKLLMDAPEQLWRLLEKHQHLHASWLFSVSRVVFRNLVKNGDDEEDSEQPWISKGIVVEESFPLAQRQWDAISTFRHQIVLRSTQDLRVWLRTPLETCHTLIALLLLDTISMSESLGLFLSQRSKALKGLISKLGMLVPTSPSRSRPSSPFSADRKQNSEAAADLLADLALDGSRASRTRRKEAVSALRETLRQVLDLLIGTLETSRAIFGADDLMEQPLIKQVLESVQSAQIIGRPNHLKHKSRLSIISSFHATPTPITPVLQTLSTTTIFESLPSSQLLLQFLPPSIILYSPYIDTSSAASQLSEEDVHKARKAWFEESLSSLEASLQIWLANLDTLTDVWDVRCVLHSYSDRMSTEEFGAAINVFDTSCLERAKVLWNASLKDIENSFSAFLEKVKDDFKGGEISDQINPESFLLSSIPHPSSPRSPNLSFVAFRKALDNRIAWRIPYLSAMGKTFQRAVRDLNSHFVHLRGILLGGLRRIFPTVPSSDVSLPSGFIDRVDRDYSEASLKTCIEIGRTLSARLDSITSSDEVVTDAIAVAESLLIGRLAHNLADSLYTRVLCRQQEIPKGGYVQLPLQAVFKRSISLWERYAIDRSVTAYATARFDFPDNPTPPRPSPALIQALLLLVDEVQLLGLPFASSEFRTVPAALLGGFLEDISSSSKLNRQQNKYDTAFLGRLIVLSLAGNCQNGTDRSPNPSDRAAIDQEIARVQLLLGPLLRITRPPEALLLGKIDRLATALLPLGPPPPQEDLTPTLDLAKLGSRFGLLLVGSTAAK
ncbi:uncharacterized protein EI90DRAFT_3229915 [Cantharellus anzutake]|uniref:uncharacterized protein n=1 Tax=Cantharellus anzutake TaxID=1750568 RepID=UPI0019051929|nr:uncharacterized protein EI90DRAFT_3229915 [Cantharellus anzutake]KAF8326349.1 hypothetical protein EI90DRAFT_3229915 [Cantharellus anzutake]